MLSCPKTSKRAQQSVEFLGSLGRFVTLITATGRVLDALLHLHTFLRSSVRLIRLQYERLRLD